MGCSCHGGGTTPRGPGSGPTPSLLTPPGTLAAIELPAESAALGQLYATLYRLTGGAMTPLIGGSLERLGYDADYTLRPGGPPLPAPRWEDVLDWQGTALTTTAPVVIDVGAAGKGQLADLLSAELRDGGCAEHFIDASGDLLNPGPDPVMVALEHPYDPTRAIGTVSWGPAPCAPPPPTGGPGATGSTTCWTAPRERRCVPSSPAGPWPGPRWWPTRSPPPCSSSTVRGWSRSSMFAWLTAYSDGHAEYSADFEGALFS